MTKKSQGRLERDAQAKAFQQVKTDDKKSIDNNCWDELNQISAKCAEALFVSNTHLRDVFRTDGLIDLIKSKEEVIVALKGITQDLEFFGQDLIRINKLHEGKSGGFKDQNDLSETLVVFEEYANFQTKYESVILPTVVFLLEQADLALAESKQKVVAEEVVNPTVVMVQKTDITDAQVNT